MQVKGNGIIAKKPHYFHACRNGLSPPEDRKNEGIIADMSQRENSYHGTLGKTRHVPHLLSRKQQEEFTDKYIEMLQIKTASREKHRSNHYLGKSAESDHWPVGFN